MKRNVPDVAPAGFLLLGDLSSGEQQVGTWLVD